MIRFERPKKVLFVFPIFFSICGFSIFNYYYYSLSLFVCFFFVVLFIFLFIFCLHLDNLFFLCTILPFLAFLIITFISASYHYKSYKSKIYMQFVRTRLPPSLCHLHQHKSSLPLTIAPLIFSQSRSRFHITRTLRQLNEEKRSASSSSNMASVENSSNHSNNNSIEALQEKVHHLEEQLKLRENIISQFMSNMLDMQQQHQQNNSMGADNNHQHNNRNPHNPDCGRFVVSTGNQIADAVANGANHILLDVEKIQNQTVYLPHTISVEGDHVLLIETLQSFLRMRNRLHKKCNNNGSSTSTSSSSSSSSASTNTELNERIKIVGNWKLSQRVKFHSHDLDYSGDENETLSLFFLSSGASLVAHNCYLGDSREAVYLSSSTSATLTQCQICNNVRGIFESYRSMNKLIGCQFIENYFHLVLLSRDFIGAPHDGGAVVTHDPQQKRLDKQKLRLELILQDGNEFFSSPRDGYFIGDGASSSSSSSMMKKTGDDSCRKVTRGDVCFKYNPMLDQYEDVFLEGSKVVLTDSQATTDLVDSTW